MAGPHAAAVLLLCALAALAPVLAPATAAEASPERTAQGDSAPRLFFTERPHEDADRFNFTTFGPGAGDEGSQVEGDREGGIQDAIVFWVWRLPAAPANWSVAAGAPWEALVFLEGLGQHLPLGVDPEDPQSVAAHDVRVVVGSEPALASGVLRVPAFASEPEPRRLIVPLEVAESRRFVQGEDTALRVTLSVTGFALADAPLLFHFGSPARPAAITAPGYPVDALRSLEEDYFRRMECHELLLQQRACETSQSEPEPEPETPTAPLPGPFVLSVAALALAAVAARQRGPSHR